jgi:hypothetical protein
MYFYTRADKSIVKTYRVTPSFIFAFLAAAIVLAFFINRAQNNRSPMSSAMEASASRAPSSENERIEEIPKDWLEKRGNDQE